MTMGVVKSSLRHGTTTSREGEAPAEPQSYHFAKLRERDRQTPATHVAVSLEIASYLEKRSYGIRGSGTATFCVTWKCNWQSCALPRGSPAVGHGHLELGHSMLIRAWGESVRYYWVSFFGSKTGPSHRFYSARR